MCSPIGHTLAAAALGRRQLKHSGFGLWIFIVVFSILPDIDFLFGAFVGDPNRYHHLWTHSFVFAILSALLVLAGLRILKESWNLKMASLAFLLVFSHIVLDFFAIDTRPAYGMPIFWPLWDRFFLSPVALFSDISKGSATRSFIPDLFCWHNVVTVTIEVILIGPMVLWAWRSRLGHGGHEIRIHRHFRRHSDIQRTGECPTAVPSAEDGS